MHHAQRAQIVLVDERVFCEGEDDGRDHEGEGNCFILDGPAEKLQLKALHDVDAQASIDWLEQENRNAWVCTD
jgi:hypothetical protein